MIWRGRCVSVPFRGISFLNPYKEIDSKGNVGFRPLPGYLISQSESPNFNKGVGRFPSPSGVSHFSMEQGFAGGRIDSVSVPFRGISFLNQKNRMRHERIRKVSVPFRGISFLNEIMKIYFERTNGFPSPSGVSHFSIKTNKR